MGKKVKCIDNSPHAATGIGVLLIKDKIYTVAGETNSEYLLEEDPIIKWLRKRFVDVDNVSDTVVESCGAKCAVCQNFNEYAEPNQPDGSFKCYSCRG